MVNKDSSPEKVRFRRDLSQEGAVQISEQSYFYTEQQVQSQICRNEPDIFRNTVEARVARTD